MLVMTTLSVGGSLVPAVAVNVIVGALSSMTGGSVTVSVTGINSGEFAAPADPTSTEAVCTPAGRPV